MHLTKLLTKYGKKIKHQNFSHLMLVLLTPLINTPFIRKYLCEFSKKFETGIGYSGAQGKLIHEKNLKLKISCQIPFNRLSPPFIFRCLILCWLTMCRFAGGQLSGESDRGCGKASGRRCPTGPQQNLQIWKLRCCLLQ
jgi:hypothetical protein